MRCDTVAQGIVEAAKKSPRRVGIIVRMQGTSLCISTLPGTNIKEAKEILGKKMNNIIMISELDEAARKAVELAK